MNNTLPISELKRHGMAAIEERLRYGPVHIVKRNKPAAVVLSEDEYQRLISREPNAVVGLSALQWLLTQPVAGARGKEDIDDALRAERDWPERD